MNKKIDVLLVSSPTPNPIMQKAFLFQGMPPLGLGYIATYLMTYGYKALVFDMNFTFNTIHILLKYIKDFEPKIIGVSCTTETYNNAIRIIKIIRKHNNNICIVLGGPHVTFEYIHTLDVCDDIDFISIGEGERSFKKICDYHIRNTLGLNDLTNVVYKSRGAIVKTKNEDLILNLDELPFPDRTLFLDYDKYSIKASVLTSRGCPGKCIFCAAHGLSGGRYRMRSAKNVADEFEYLKSLGNSHVTVVDDTMTASINRLYEFTDELTKRNTEMTWYCESRLDVVSREMLLKMKAAGLIEIQFGVESGSQRILDHINKGIDLSYVKSVFKLCKTLRIKPITNLIIGQPLDTPDTIRDTISLGNELIEMGVHVTYTICTPFPGTPLWSNPQDFDINIIDTDLDHYSTYHPVFDTKYLNSDEIRNWFYIAMREKSETLSRIIEKNIKQN